jgi:subtilisin family serine protease
MKSILLSALASLTVFAAPLKDQLVGPEEYVVIFKEGACAETTQIVGSLFQDDSFASAKLIHEYTYGFAAELNEKALAHVRSMPEVEIIEQNKVYSIRETQEDVPSWGLARLWQRDFESTETYKYPAAAGENVDVYVIDTGVYVDHEDFEGRAKFGFNAVAREGDVDGNGHGTHVSSTIAGKLYGVAKKATIIGVKVLNAYGSGTLADVIKGIDWAASNAKKSGKKSVANMSLGGGKSAALDNAVAKAIKNGLIMAVAAGNSAADACSYSPANVPDAITVAASDKFDSLAYFSNYGKCVDIIAPGHQITGAWIGRESAQKTISGTSMASPHVAGVAALLLSQDQTLGPADIKTALQKSSTQNYIKKIQKDTPNFLLFNNYQGSEELKQDKVVFQKDVEYYF